MQECGAGVTGYETANCSCEAVVDLPAGPQRASAQVCWASATLWYLALVPVGTAPHGNDAEHRETGSRPLK